MFLNTFLIFLYGCGLIFTFLVMRSNLKDRKAIGESINWPKNILVAFLIWVLSPLWMAWGLYKLIQVLTTSTKKN